MSNAEIFSQSRMDRCAEIQRAIMLEWRKTNYFNYVVRATERVSGIELCELRRLYFTVGIGDDVRDIPFHDMLVVFSMIEQEIAASRKRAATPEARNEANFTIKYQISTEFSDEEAVRLLSGIRIETPFDEGKYLRIQSQ